jgi:hypothetical protein
VLASDDVVAQVDASPITVSTPASHDITLAVSRHYHVVSSPPDQAIAARTAAQAVAARAAGQAVAEPKRHHPVVAEARSDHIAGGRPPDAVIPGGAAVRHLVAAAWGSRRDQDRAEEDHDREGGGGYCEAPCRTEHVGSPFGG